MQYIYDLVPVVIIAVLAAIYHKKGFLDIILKAVTWLAALIFAWFFSSFFAGDMGESVTVGSTTVPITRSVLFFVVFFVVSIVLQLVSKSLQSLIDRIPLVGTANHLLGMVIGVVLGVLFCYILINVVAVIIYTSNESLSWMNTELINKTLFFKYAYQYNLLQHSPFG